MHVGSTRITLGTELADQPFNLKALPHGWETIKPESSDQLVDRIQRMKEDLYEFARFSVNGGVWKNVEMKKNNGPVEILVVSHASFLRRMLGRGQFHGFQFAWNEKANSDPTESYLSNAEFKSYMFASHKEIS